MIGLLQRVSRAQVTVDGEVAGKIGPGLLVLAAVERGDTEAQASRLAERIVNYRVFPDAGGRMNLSLRQTGGELLLVSQFTLAADTRKGTRPGFSKAAPPGRGQEAFRAAGSRKRRRRALPCKPASMERTWMLNWSIRAP